MIALPRVEWREYLGETLPIGVYLIAFYDGAQEPDISYEIGFSEPPNAFTTADGTFIPGVWAYARLDAHNAHPGRNG